MGSGMKRIRNGVEMETYDEAGLRGGVGESSVENRAADVVPIAEKMGSARISEYMRGMVLITC